MISSVHCIVLRNRYILYSTSFHVGLKYIVSARFVSALTYILCFCFRINSVYQIPFSSQVDEHVNLSVGVCYVVAQNKIVLTANPFRPPNSNRCFTASQFQITRTAKTWGLLPLRCHELVDVHCFFQKGFIFYSSPMLCFTLLRIVKFGA